MLKISRCANNCNGRCTRWRKCKGHTASDPCSGSSWEHPLANATSAPARHAKGDAIERQDALTHNKLHPDLKLCQIFGSPEGAVRHWRGQKQAPRATRTTTAARLPPAKQLHVSTSSTSFPTARSPSEASTRIDGLDIGTSIVKGSSCLRISLFSQSEEHWLTDIRDSPSEVKPLLHNFLGQASCFAGGDRESSHVRSFARLC